MGSIIRKSLRFFAVFLGLVFGFFLLVYMNIPVYKFEKSQPFHGEKWYNPYQNMKPENWRKYNFQVQSNAWLGITDGRVNSNELIDSVYNLLGYDHVATSDYQSINYHGAEKSSFIPTYEHGYNVGRIHQVCIGAERVFWTDFVYWLILHAKQWVIDNLQRNSELVAIAHPRNDGSYSFKEMAQLTNYHLIEALNNIGCSVDRWDVALSSGKPIWILGNDDAHNVLNTMKVGRKFTMINSESTKNDDIIRALKTGNTYGVKYMSKIELSMSELAEKHKNIPQLEAVNVVDDTLEVISKHMPNRIVFVGQNGNRLDSTSHSKIAHYPLKEADTYVRVELWFPESTIVYLNPVLRSESGEMPNLTRASINRTSTIILQIGYFVLIFLVCLYLLRNKRIRLKNYINLNKRRKALKHPDLSPT